MSVKEVEDLPKSVTGSVQTLHGIDNTMKQTDDAVQLILGQDYDSLVGQLQNLESAKLNVAIAFTLASLCYANLQTQGQDLTNHGIHDDLQRIKGFVARINSLEKKAAATTPSKAPEAPTVAAQLSPPLAPAAPSAHKKEQEKKVVEASEEEENPRKRSKKVDAKAAARMIKHNL
eukprot:gene12972-9279_t